MAFVRWNEITQIWEKAVTPENPSTAWNHLPIANPTQPLDTVNKQYVDAAVAGVSGFVPYNGATANVNLGLFSIKATLGNFLSPNNSTTGPILGAFGNAAIAVSFSGAHGLAIGTDPTGNTWVQSQRFDSFAITYNIRLQPAGGDVTMGGNLFVAGNVAEQNRGQFMGYWGTYTPRWRGYGGSDGVIGNGSITGRFSRVGRTVTVTIQLFIGTSTTLAPSHWSFELPFAAAGSALEGSAVLYDGTLGSIFGGTIVPANYFFGHPNAIGIVCGNFLSPPGSDSFVNPNYPWTWKANDSIFITIVYEQT